MEVTTNAFLKLFAISVCILLLNSCKVFLESRFVGERNFALSFNQPADQLLAWLDENPNFVLTPANASSLVQNSNLRFNALENIAKQDPQLFSVIVQFLPVNATPLQLAELIQQLLQTDAITNTKDAKEVLHVVVKLYPLFTYRISESLLNLEPRYKNSIRTYLSSQKLDANFVLPKDKQSQKDISITPLINSLSLSLNNLPYTGLQAKDIYIQIRNDQLDFANKITLYYEPVAGAYSGSIFDLSANTTYSIDISYTGQNFDVSKSVSQKLTVRTRSNKPTVDANNIHYLKNIYQGGTIDIEALGIKGKPNAWAQIDGTGVTISSGEKTALDIGSNSYIYFTNLTIKGGKRHAIVAQQAHNLWFDTCNISQWGQQATNMRGGVGFKNKNTKKPINYDAAFALARTGVVVVENCEVHSPNGTANSWEFGHPQGPTAMLVSANHPNSKYQGQYIVRNNRFYGSEFKRFNDVVETRNNGRPWGGFIRDSVIHNNYLAYANDDGIEIDGGQHNVAVYNNMIEHTYTGVSAIPNMRGPSYVFANKIGKLGDQGGKKSAALKLGGLFSRPAGLVIEYENEITNQQRKVAKASFKGDRLYWLESLSNQQ